MAERIRGAALRAFARWYGREHGGDRLRRSLGGLDQAERRSFDASRLDLGVRGGRWYPAPTVHRILEGLIDDLPPEAADELIRRAAREIIEASLSGFLGPLLRLFVSPETCRLFSQQLWSFHYRSGRVAIEAVGRRAHRMQVRDWRSHHLILCRLHAAAGVPIYGAAGCRGVTSRIEACVDRGDPCCVYWTEWR